MHYMINFVSGPLVTLCHGSRLIDTARCGLSTSKKCIYSIAWINGYCISVYSVKRMAFFATDFFQYKRPRVNGYPPSLRWIQQIGHFIRDISRRQPCMLKRQNRCLSHICGSWVIYHCRDRKRKCYASSATSIRWSVSQSVRQSSKSATLTPIESPKLSLGVH
jgi:hypothetical protein